MAKNLKPNVENLGPEGQITFKPPLEGQYFDNLEALVDGSMVTSQYGIMMNNGNRRSIEFELLQDSVIWAYGHNYNDSGGSTPTSIDLYEKNDKEYSFIHICNTRNENEGWYRLTIPLKKGIYRLGDPSVDTGYTSFKEWYIETIDYKANENTITINNEVLKFSNIIYVSKHGSDLNSGTKEFPLATISKAVDRCNEHNSCIYITEGEYNFDSIYGTNYFASCIYDKNTWITFLGDKCKTIINYEADKTTHATVCRDISLISLYNKNSKIINITFNFTPKSLGENYQKSLFNHSKGIIYNCVFNIFNDYSLSYHNYTYGLPEIENCLFNNKKGKQIADFSGTIKYTNCLFKTKPYGTLQYNCITRDILNEDYSNVVDDCKNTGDINKNNPDGTRSNIGIYGGKFSCLKNYILIKRYCFLV